MGSVGWTAHAFERERRVPWLLPALRRSVGEAECQPRCRIGITRACHPPHTRSRGGTLVVDSATEKRQAANAVWRYVPRGVPKKHGLEWCVSNRRPPHHHLPSSTSALSLLTVSKPRSTPNCGPYFLPLWSLCGPSTRSRGSVIPSPSKAVWNQICSGHLSVLGSSTLWKTLITTSPSKAAMALVENSTSTTTSLGDASVPVGDVVGGAGDLGDSGPLKRAIVASTPMASRAPSGQYLAMNEGPSMSTPDPGGSFFRRTEMAMLPKKGSIPRSPAFAPSGATDFPRPRDPNSGTACVNVTVGFDTKWTIRSVLGLVMMANHSFPMSQNILGTPRITKRVRRTRRRGMSRSGRRSTCSR
mmetsp:Transcript_30960/g.95612  ORF Transcript_30960/g.95612 Transcript_30960/m.95612 type:complete len:358 (+) Transcript_30960:26-1099(+)